MVMERKRGEEVGDRGEGLSKQMHQQACGHRENDSQGKCSCQGKEDLRTDLGA